ncbi:MAG: glycoside hydrolase family 78 protein [Gemmatimonadota bacterium]|nr:glycoside hydrolase family 78 protein [Gemmatimonadota bacterium]
MNVTRLRCEYLENPLGIDETRPRLSWILESSERGQKQTAYRILVASSEENLENDLGDLWDTGKVASDRTTHIVYDGKEPTSRMRYYWKVCAWGKNGRVTAFSAPGFWSMGLLSDSEWKGEWIGMKAAEPKSGCFGRDKGLPPGPPVPCLRKTFTLSKPVSRAFIYVSARGLFELHLNGERVGRDIFAPEWTDYLKRIQYRTYEVTSLLTKGENALGALLGDGWYSGYLGWTKKRGHYGLQNSLLLNLVVKYEDGSGEVIVTDETWRCSESPIMCSDILMGETYDARRENPGWDTAGFHDSSWQPVITVEKPEAQLVAQMSQPVRVTEYIASVAITEPLEGVYVFDLGQNIAGWARLKVKGESGTLVTLRFAERLNPDGTIYTTNLRAAKCTDRYILKGGGQEVFEPRFTFHGFQYVEVTGFPGNPDKDAVTGCVVHSNTPPAGRFECSNPMVNKLWLNTRWSQRGNFLSIPTDCPQRDERLGWMGDAQIFIRTATFNMDVAAFFTKWMVDVEDSQSEQGMFSNFSPKIETLFTSGYHTEGAPGWGDAGIIVPWTIYRVYGDTRVIERHYRAMTRWMDFILEGNSDLIRTNRLGENYGDWLSINADTPKDLLATAYWAYDARLMSEMAKAVGLKADARKYEKLFQDIRAVFQDNFVSPDGRIKGDTQTGYLLALYMNLLPEEMRSMTAKHLVEDIKEKGWHLSTGFIGVRHLNPVLTRMGYADVAYRLLNNDTFPSWLYPIRNGATTIWERWDGWTEEKGFQTPGMNSFNHYSLGSITEWLYRFVAGVDLDPKVPGFRSIVIHPYPGGSLEYAGAEYNSIHGKILSEWRRKGDSFELDIMVPANTCATVYVPADEETTVTESGMPADSAQGVTLLNRENGYAVFAVGSGIYSFVSELTD